MRWSRISQGLVAAAGLTATSFAGSPWAAEAHAPTATWPGGFVKTATHPGVGGSPTSAPRSAMPSLSCPDKRARCTWERTFGGALEDKAHAITVTANDHIWVAGYSRSHIGFEYDAWVICLDRGGRLVWDRRFGGKRTDQIYAMAPTSSGGVVVAGYTRSQGAGGSDAWIVRLDSRGNLVWERTFGGEREDRARTVAATGDGGFVVGGFTRSGDSENADGFVLRLTADGSVLWSSVFGDAEEDGIFGIATMPAGGFVATGYTDQTGDHGYDLWVLRLNEKGGTVWTRQLGLGSFDAGAAVAATADGGAVVVGVTSEDSFTQDDAWVLRLDADGVLLWDRRLGGPKVEAAWGVVATNDGGFVVTAATSSFGAGSVDAWLLRLDADGAVNWERAYGGKAWDRPTAITMTKDGDLLMVGSTTTKGAGYEDYWVLRLDAEGWL
ncbi:MAG: hypothetical protein QNK18_04795 [Gammaproteobacteria bacterium]|nr:hypothetical protein [Gammaproteobacteria bacterium]